MNNKTSLVPNLLTEIIYKSKGVGCVPLLNHVVTHGFSWGVESGNMSFAWENDKEAVTNRVTAFLTKLEMEPIEGTVNMSPEHGVNIIDITDETFIGIGNNKIGASLKCDAFFTTMVDLPLVVKPADCTVSIIYAESEKGEKILGMVHAGRLGLDLQFPIKAMDHLLKYYKVIFSTVIIGIIPTITKKRYYIRQLKELLKPEGWAGYVEEREGVFYLDFVGYLLNQYMSIGIKSSQIQAYDVDTYEATLRGETFSHRYWREMDQKIPNGRMIVSAKL